MKVLPCAFPPCHKRFSSQFTLRRHIDTFHHRIKRHHCLYCPKSFAYAHTLRQHVHRHSEDQPAVTYIPRLTDMLAAQREEQWTPVEKLASEQIFLPELVRLDSGSTKEPLTNIFT